MRRANVSHAWKLKGETLTSSSYLCTIRAIPSGVEVASRSSLSFKAHIDSALGSSARALSRASQAFTTSPVSARHSALRNQAGTSLGRRLRRLLTASRASRHWPISRYRNALFMRASVLPPSSAKALP